MCHFPLIIINQKQAQGKSSARKFSGAFATSCPDQLASKYELFRVYPACQTADKHRLRPTHLCSEHHGGADSKIRVIEQHKYLIDLRVGDEPGVDGLLPNLLEVGTEQVCAGRPALPHGQIADW
jgi:hypothetical protein